MSVYLDFNASAPIDERVLEVMISTYKNIIGNADSRTHDFGAAANKVVENARKRVAHILGISSSEVLFTSGSTESNNIAVQGLRDYAKKTEKKHIITTSIEHKSVLESAKALQKEGFEVDFLEPDSSGKISVERLKELVRTDTLLVSVMHVNNETGIIQPVSEIGEYLSDKNIYFHVDATQSFGKLVDELKNLKYDMLSMSAHKISGPQGVGVLVLRKKNHKSPPVTGIMYGGQQERGIRPGTIPVALIAGLGKACILAEENYADNEIKCRHIKDEIIKILSESGVSYEINGKPELCICSTLNICFHGVSSEALMLSTKHYLSISNGSACNSNSYKPSYVLSAMGIPEEKIYDSVRISWGPQSDEEEIKEAIKRIAGMASSLAF